MFTIRQILQLYASGKISKSITVNKYGHVLMIVEKLYYSVHYKQIGKRFKVQYTTTQLQVYDEDKIVAVHDRYLGKNNGSTFP